MFNNFNYLLKFHLPEPIWIRYLQMKSLKVYLSNIVLRNNRCEDIRYFSTKKESVQLIQNLINIIVFSLLLHIVDIQLRLKNCRGNEYFTDEEFEQNYGSDSFQTTRPTTPIFYFTQANIRHINFYCNQTISTLTAPVINLKTSTITLTPFSISPWPSRTTSKPFR